MLTVKYFEIVIKTYHGEPVGRLRYFGDKDYESNLYSMPGLYNIIQLWREGVLLGSFGVDTRLAQDATFRVCAE